MLIIGFSCYAQELRAKSPHGQNLAIDCTKCHSPASWKMDGSLHTFNHGTDTSYPLAGQHEPLECAACHKSLIFSEIGSTCISCHTDFHQQTVGIDCARCHTPKSWIVEDITRMHEKTSFPLMGVHSTQDCAACHTSETLVNFKPTGVTCLDCHRSEYIAAKQPDHQANNFSTDCSSCHSITGTAWKGDPILHSFFPLEQGHKGIDCFGCHKPPAYTGLDANCISCHADALNAAQSVDHSLFPTDCKLCHTLAIGWKPAGFSSHDAYFPIYSGKHKGEWNECIDCHIQTSNYKIFSCINCHEHNNAQKMAKEHDEVSGFKFESMACFGCHPRGD